MTDQMFQTTSLPFASLPFDRVRTLLEQFDALDPIGREELQQSLSTLPSDQLARLRADPALSVAVDRVSGPYARDAGLWIPGAAFSVMLLIIAIFLFLAWKASA